MGQNQRSETAGLIAGLFSMLLSALLMSIFLDNAPAVWLVAGRRRLVGSAIVAVFSSILGRGTSGADGGCLSAVCWRSFH